MHLVTPPITLAPLPSLESYATRSSRGVRLTRDSGASKPFRLSGGDEAPLQAVPIVVRDEVEDVSSETGRRVEMILNKFNKIVVVVEGSRAYTPAMLGVKFYSHLTANIKILMAAQYMEEGMWRARQNEEPMNRRRSIALQDPPCFDFLLSSFRSSLPFKYLLIPFHKPPPNRLCLQPHDRVELFHEHHVGRPHPLSSLQSAPLCHEVGHILILGVPQLPDVRVDLDTACHAVDVQVVDSCCSHSMSVGMIFWVESN